MIIYKVTFPFSCDLEDEDKNQDFRFCPSLQAVKETIALMTKDTGEVSGPPLYAGIIRVEKVIVEKLDKLALCRLFNEPSTTLATIMKFEVVQDYRFIPGKRLQKYKSD